MLQTLEIENVALIDKATLNFDERLNVISGETGAGKSILLDSLTFVFGGRADRTLIRTGASSMKVKAIFSCVSEKQIQFIKDNFEIDCSDELFVVRELDSNGKNTCKINGELVPVSMVKKICQQLVDVHGQSEHLAILDNEYQLKIIDLYGKTPQSLFDELNEIINEYKENENQLKLLGGSEKEKQNLIDLFSFQIQEIESAKIKENELEELLQEKQEMNQFEKINNNLKLAYDSFSKSGYDESALEKINNAKKSMQNISSINNKYQQLFERIESSLIEIQDIAETINIELGNNVFDEERFEYVDHRIDYLKSLFRKYGGDYKSLINYYEEISQKLDNLINSTEKYEKLLKNKEKTLKKLENIQNLICEHRKETSEKFKVDMENELKILGMPNAKIDIKFTKIQELYTSVGNDFVEFMFSANLGFEPKQLNKVVSGGEMSRVMLAYKILLSTVDYINTMIFDEIDTGLSGNIASVVAQYMARLSKNKQIIAISHLPQICAMADRNIKVEKYIENNKTRTKSVVLNESELLNELVRLMGVEADQKGLAVCKELKEKSNNYKKII